MTASNAALAAEPEAINSDAYGKGWLMRVRPSAGGAGATFLSPAEYEKLIAEEGG